MSVALRHEVLRRRLQEAGRLLKVVADLAGDEPFEPDPPAGRQGVREAVIEIAGRREDLGGFVGAPSLHQGVREVVACRQREPGSRDPFQGVPENGDGFGPFAPDDMDVRPIDDRMSDSLLVFEQHEGTCGPVQQSEGRVELAELSMQGGLQQIDRCRQIRLDSSFPVEDAGTGESPKRLPKTAANAESSALHCQRVHFEIRDRFRSSAGPRIETADDRARQPDQLRGSGGVAGNLLLAALQRMRDESISVEAGRSEGFLLFSPIQGEELCNIVWCGFPS